jgi:ribosomal-protein-alanine N-acetyltransferase
MPEQISLETERLLLRPYRDDDFDTVHAYASDPVVVRYTLWGPDSEQETREFIQLTHSHADADPRTDYDFAIVLKESGLLIGGCKLMLRSPVNKDAEIGYVLNPVHWGHGYMPEACSSLLELGFGSLGLHRIYARCHPENVASARVMQKLGMTYEGCLRECVLGKGGWWDFQHYGILEQEWKSVNQ